MLGGVCDDSAVWALNILEQRHAVLEGRSQAEQGRDEPLAMARDAYGSAPAPSGSRRRQVSGSFFHVVAQAPDEGGGHGDA